MKTQKKETFYNYFLVDKNYIFIFKIKSKNELYIVILSYI